MKKQILDNADVTSSSKQIAVLKQHFPACFDKDGNFMPDKLSEIVKAEGADISREGYSLNWLGKSYARLMANLNTETLLAANTEHNEKPENKHSENILIQGDNLDVLKHLKNAYAEQIKMIYIDPPYNTGSDGFVYQDDRKFTVEELVGLAGIEEDEAKRILDFAQSNSNSHSAWLTFMYPRLYIARELLSDDGVIFISIDDNEEAQLKLLCNEIFGEDNSVASLVWKRRASSALDDANISKDHEVVLSFSKSSGFAMQGQQKDFAAYKNPDNDSRGDWVSGDLTVGMTSTMRPNQAYDLVDPKTGDTYPCNPNRVWSYIPESMAKLVGEGRIIFPKDTTKRPMLKRFKSELKSSINPTSTILVGKVGLNTEGTKIINELFGFSAFNYTKPVSLVKLLTQQAVKSDETVLDFFAGSGTSAHAVMVLNAEDGGKRRHISVQLNEPTDEKSEAKKAGYETVFEITRDRISKAAKKIQAENPNADCDFGFKEFKTTPVFDGYLNEADTPDQYTIFEGDKLSDEQRAQLLLTWQVYDGLPLTLDLETVDLEGYTAHQGNHILYCINSGLTLDHILKMLERIDTEKSFAPQKIVVFEYILSSKAKREIMEAVKGYNNRKQIELHLEIRL